MLSQKRTHSSVGSVITGHAPVIQPRRLVGRVKPSQDYRGLIAGGAV